MWRDYCESYKEQTSWSISVVDPSHVCVRTHNHHTKSVGCSYFNHLGEKLIFFMPISSLPEKQKQFTERSAAIPYLFLHASSCGIDWLKRDLKFGSLQELGWCRSPSKKECCPPFPSQADIQNGCSSSVTKHVRTMYTFITRCATLSFKTFEIILV